MSLPDLIAQFAQILNREGPDSEQADKFIWDHRNEDPEFSELAETARRLKRAFLADEGNSKPEGEVLHDNVNQYPHR